MRPGATAQAVIAALGLQPHPEGGWFAETFRDVAVDADGRAASTAIYYLLKAGERSAWHRVDAAEVWHFYAGDPLRLRLKQDDGEERIHLLGPDLAAGQRPQCVVAAGEWQAAEPLGAWTLVGCTVAPGFAFAGFELAKGFV
jgi:predicted cupin superfamily sugar epimerase